MAKYRKKPVVIDAIKFEYSEEGIKALKEFCDGALMEVWKEAHPLNKGKGKALLCSDTTTGWIKKHTATEGDYIIKKIDGEVCPKKPDIFAATYDLVEEPEKAKHETGSAAGIRLQINGH
jgi:hypothetical protein